MAMRAFQIACPQVTVEIEEVSPQDFVQAIEDDRVDMGVGTLEAAHTGLQEQPLLREHLVVAAIPSPEFRAGVAITWKQLALLPLVTARSGYGIRRRIDAAATQAGVTLHIAQEVSLLGTAVALAAAGMGVVIAPPSLVANESSLVIRRSTRPGIERVISIVRRRERSLSPAAAAFASILQSTTR